MKILNYIIPEEFKNEPFIISLHKQFKSKGKLSIKQTYALQDIIGVEVDFYAHDFKEINEKLLDDNPYLQDDFNELRAKLERNRFRATKGRNKCVRALQSIIDEKPNAELINDALGRNYFSNYHRRW